MKDKKQVLRFLMICLPITWGLMWLSVLLEKRELVQISTTVYGLSCFMPMITAIICCRCEKESIRELCFLPRFKGNFKIYLLAVICGIVISVWDVPLISVLLFPDVGTVNQDTEFLRIVFQILLTVAIACVMFFVLLGEEIGWMGYLYPRLEKMLGINFAIMLTGFVRGIWHIVMLAQNEKIIENVVILCLTNIVGGYLLVLLTKLSETVVPSAIVHSINNTLPAIMYGFITIEQAEFEKYEVIINVISYIPYVVIMFVSMCILIKKYKKCKVLQVENN